MAAFRTADLGRFNGTTDTLLVPAPPAGAFRISAGGLVWFNADIASRTFTIELRGREESMTIFNKPVAAGVPFTFGFPILLPAGFDGIFGRLDAAPSTQPTFYYMGEMQ
jgi:hypothetical protein